MSDENEKLPLGWTRSDLGEVADVQWGNTSLTKKYYIEEGFTAYSASGPDGFLNHFEHEGEGIVLSAIGARCGKCFRADGKWTAIKNTITVTGFSLELVTRDFLFPFLNDESRWRKKGGGQPFIALKGARAEKVLLPPLPEQKRIVSKIESLQERSRAAREALDEVGPLLEKFRQSVLSAAFRGDLTKEWREKHPDVEPASELLNRIRQERRQKWEATELAKYEAKGKQPPKGWEDKYKEPKPIQTDELEILQDQSLPEGWLWAPAELIVEPEAEIVYGIVQPGKKLDEGVPYVRGKDIVAGRILVDQLLMTSELIAAKYERASLKGGDILLGIIRATKVAIVPKILDGANITQGTARFRPSNIIRTEFLAGWLDSPYAQNWLHDHYRGIDMPGLNLRDVRRLPVPIAPLTEQELVELKITAAIRSISNAQVKVAESKLSLTQLDQSILAKAFRGELVPQDPNDEPASVLLERIRKQREATEAEKKTKKKSRTRTNKKAGGTLKPVLFQEDKKLLNALLEAGKPLDADELRVASGLSSKEFYSRLKKAIACGIITEELKENERKIVPVK